MPYQALQCTLGLFLFLYIAGCSNPTATDPRTTQAIAEFNDILATQGKIIFLSNSGHYIGMDGDADIMFLHGGDVEATSYGFAVARYQGKFKLDDSGVISLKWNTKGREWSQMVLYKDATSLLVRLKDAKIDADSGDKNGASSFWPFRRVDRQPFDKPAKGLSRPDE